MAGPSYSLGKWFVDRAPALWETWLQWNWGVYRARRLSRGLLRCLKTRVGQPLRQHRVVLTLAAGLAVVVLGYVGFQKRQTGSVSLGWDVDLDLLYQTLQLFTLESGSQEIKKGGRWSLEFEIARFAAPLLTAFSFVQALKAFLRERQLKGHVVICGLGRKGLLLAQSFHKCGLPVVAIEKDDGNEYLHDCPGYVITGNATSTTTLERARIDTARYVICVCGEDGDNARIAMLVKGMSQNRRGRPLTCFIHVTETKLRDYRQQERRSGPSRCRLHFFNILNSGARRVLHEYSPFPEKKALSAPHILVVGVGYLGESLVVRTAESWQHREDARKFPVKITMIDADADKKKAVLEAAYPELAGVWDLQALTQDVKNPAFEQADFLTHWRGHAAPSYVYVALGDDQLTRRVAENLHRRLVHTNQKVVACVTHEDDASCLLFDPHPAADHRSGVATFGLIDRTCQPALLFEAYIEDLARAFHQEWARDQREEVKAQERAQALAASQGAQAAPPPAAAPVKIPSWDELTPEMKESNRQRADSLVWILQVGGYILTPPLDLWTPAFAAVKIDDSTVDKIARLEHERWRAERERQGWRYGEKKDPVLKTNPLLRPWEELPEEEKEDNRRMVRRYPKLLANVGLLMVPKDSPLEP